MLSPCFWVKALPRLLGHGRIGGGQEVRQRFENGHIGTEALPHRAKFETDDAGPDDAEALGYRIEGEGADVVADHLVVNRNTVQVTRAGTGGDDHVFGIDDFVGTLLADHPDLPQFVVAPDEAAVTGAGASPCSS